MKIGLVLEGGGNRGIYTAGVVDSFLDNDIHINYVLGVSIGANIGMSYISKQKGRTKKQFERCLEIRNSLVISEFIKGRNLINFDFIIDDMAYNLEKFDYDAFYNSKQDFIVGATNCENGNLDFFEKDPKININTVVRASCSIPFLAKPVMINGTPYLDGGIIDNIPIEKAFKDGCDKVIVVLTRHESYNKKYKVGYQVLKKGFYKHPKVGERLNERPEKYHLKLKKLKELEKKGKIFIIRSNKKLNVSLIDINPKNINNGYNQGYHDGHKLKKDILEFIGTDKFITK